MKSTMKLALIDGEYKLASIPEFKYGAPNTQSYKPWYEMFWTQYRGELLIALSKRKQVCRDNLIMAMNHGQIESEDEYAYYFDGKHFSKPAYAAMEELFEILSSEKYHDGKGLDEVFKENSLMANQLLKAVACEIDFPGKQYVVDVLAELVHVA